VKGKAHKNKKAHRNVKPAMRSIMLLQIEKFFHPYLGFYHHSSVPGFLYQSFCRPFPKKHLAGAPGQHSDVLEPVE
jgi:hypothetical protein